MKRKVKMRLIKFLSLFISSDFSPGSIIQSKLNNIKSNDWCKSGKYR